MITAAIDVLNYKNEVIKTLNASGRTLSGALASAAKEVRGSRSKVREQDELRRWRFVNVRVIKTVKKKNCA